MIRQRHLRLYGAKASSGEGGGASGLGARVDEKPEELLDIPEELLAVAEQINNGIQPDKKTVRTFIGWYKQKGRGRRVVEKAQKHLAKLNVRTEPDFNVVNIDSEISFLRAIDEGTDNEDGLAETAPFGATSGTNDHLITQTFVVGAGADPTHRISRLASANRAPIRVHLDSTLQEAVNLMLLYDFSKLPVMQGERDVKGMVSYASIALGKLSGRSSNVVRDYMEPHREIRSDASLFEAIPLIMEHEYVLVRGPQSKISGIVTTSDLSEQFGQLGEPFLLVGEVENHIRRLVVGKFTAEELAEHRAPSDDGRVVENVEDLTIGEYKRLLEKQSNWDRLGLEMLDRKVFIEQLENVRQIRNRVMHFEPDGLEEEDLEILRRFTVLLRKLQRLGET